MPTLTPSQRAEKWKRENPEREKATREKYRKTEKYRKALRNRWYRNRYGISLLVYDTLLEKQNNVCAICFQPERGKNTKGVIKPLAVDHCHQTGKVRGLLCSHCNSILGQAKDNIETLASAIQYLKGDSIEH